MTNHDREALQEHIMSLIPETIDTDAGTHICLLYKERLKIAKAVTDGLICKFEEQVYRKQKLNEIFGSGAYQDTDTLKEASDGKA